MQKKVLGILSVLIIALCIIYLVPATSAKYRKKTNAIMNASIAKWNIKVNNETIANKETLTNTITPVFDDKETVSKNVIAPGSTGHFDLIIDPSEADVSFDYNIKVEADPTSSVTDLIVTDYEILEQANSKVPYTSEVTGSFTHNSVSNTIRFYIKWNDDDTNTMTNKDDTDAAINVDSKALLKVTLFFSQKETT